MVKPVPVTNLATAQAANPGRSLVWTIPRHASFEGRLSLGLPSVRPELTASPGAGPLTESIAAVELATVLPLSAARRIWAVAG